MVGRPWLEMTNDLVQNGVTDAMLYETKAAKALEFGVDERQGLTLVHFSA
jgi:hypothetical protein